MDDWELRQVFDHLAEKWLSMTEHGDSHGVRYTIPELLYEAIGWLGDYRNALERIATALEVIADRYAPGEREKHPGE